MEKKQQHKQFVFLTFNIIVMLRLFTLIGVFGLLSITNANAQDISGNLTMNTLNAKNPGSTSLANVSMWPNPAKGSVNVYINSIRIGDRGQYVLYNAAGKPCLIENIQNGSNKIFFNALPEGMYFANIKLRSGITFTKKLMIIKQL